MYPSQAAIGGWLKEQRDSSNRRNGLNDEKSRPRPLVELPLSGDPPPTPDQPVAPSEPASTEPAPNPGAVNS